MATLRSIPLLPKFLLIFVPTLLLLAAPGFGWLLSYDARGDLEALTLRIGNQAARAASAIGRHRALENPALLRDLLSPLLLERGIDCVAVTTTTDAGMKETVTGSGACTARVDKDHLFDIPIGDERDSTISVQFRDGELLREHALKRNLLLGGLAALVLLAAVTAYIVLRGVVGHRLRSMLSAIEHIAAGGARLPIAGTGNDELGRIMRAFNEMLEREDERELLLQASIRDREAAHAEQERLNTALETAMRTSERRFRDFVASASDWYWEMDAELRFSYFSDRFTTVTGVPNTALLGKTREETGIPNVNPGAWQEHLDNLHNHRPFRRFEHPRTMSDGRIVWLSISGTPMFDESGDFTGYRGTGSDITAEKRAIELLRDSQVAERASRTKSQFLANMSHEIRTPINGVLGMTEVLLKTSLDAKQRRFAENVSRSAHGLITIVNDILDFSKLDEGKVVLDSAPFDLRELVEDIHELFAVAANDKGIVLAAAVPADLHTSVRGDAGRLRQVLTNLIGNGIKFTHQGEVVTRVSLEDSGARRLLMRFEVSDSGIGIAQSAQSSIFESFAQADGSTSREYGGTGLGLAISARLVALMEGDIGVRSVPGEGATFWFTVALEREAPPTAQPEASAQLAAMRVLIVDDNATNREILAAHLDRWCDISDCAADATEALSKLRDAVDRGQPYDAVLLDRRMPDMDGLALAKLTADDGRIGGVRRIMLSSICDSQDPEAFSQAKIDSWLTKPVRQKELFQCLSSLAEGAPARVWPVDQAGGVDEAPQPLFEGHLLVAEDNLVNREVVIELLEPLGVTLDVVGDGQAAVYAARSSRYDLILMDCQMPRMNGFDATQRIREHETNARSKRVPILALTANALAGDRERCLEAGMDDYLTKPISQRDLRNALERWLDRLEEDSERTSADRVPGSTADDHEPSIDPAREAVNTDPAPAESLEPESTPHETAFDQSVLEGWRSRERAGRSGIVKKLIDAWLQQSDGLAKDLRAALARGDIASVREAAHPLKSSSSQVGARRLATLCAGIEQACRDNDLAGLESRTKAFDDAYAEAREVLRCENERLAA